MNNMIVVMWRVGEQMEVYPNGSIKKVVDQMVVGYKAPKEYKSSQLLSIRALEREGWKLSNTNSWKEVEA
jgi:hypothetical protein